MWRSFLKRSLFEIFSGQGCDSGYEAINGICENIDECATNQHDCKTGSRKTNSLCHDTDGSFYCSCLPGRELDRNGYCRDIDECEDGSHKCSELAKCKNTRTYKEEMGGGYTCECQNTIGYEMIGKAWMFF